MTTTAVGIFCALKLKFYAFENFAGLKPSNFVLGVFLSSILVSCLVACVFCVGLFFKCSKDWQVDKADRTVHFFGSQKGLIGSGGWLHDNNGDGYKGQDFYHSPMKCFIVKGCYQTSSFPGSTRKTQQSEYKRLSDEIKADERAAGVAGIAPAEAEKIQGIIQERIELMGSKYYKIFAWTFINLFVLCLLGSAIGIFLAALFKLPEYTTLAAVVLYVAF